MGRTKVDNIRISAETADMMRITAALGEGDMGKAFTSFALFSRILGEVVIRDALAKYRAYQHYWSTMGAFAQNYAETVYKVTEPHTSGHALPSDQNAWDMHLIDIWERWGRIVSSLTRGTDEDF